MPFGLELLTKDTCEVMVLHVVFALFAVPSFALELFSSSGDCISYLLSEGTECVTTSGYPRYYNGESYCEVVIGNAPVSLDVRSFHTQRYWDSLKMTDAAYGVTYEYSGHCCPSSSLECDCDDLVEGLSANSKLTWSSNDDSVSFSGWKICMSEDRDENDAPENEDDDSSGVEVKAVLRWMARGWLLFLLVCFAVMCLHKSCR